MGSDIIPVRRCDAMTGDRIRPATSMAMMPVREWMGDDRQPETTGSPPPEPSERIPQLPTYALAGWWKAPAGPSPQPIGFLADEVKIHVALCPFPARRGFPPLPRSGRVEEACMFS